MMNGHSEDTFPAPDTIAVKVAKQINAPNNFFMLKTKNFIRISLIFSINL